MYFKKLLSSNQFILIIIIINLIIRFPQNSHAIGNDAFVVLWMSKTISLGWYDAWLINPLSLFGLYPFSEYPFGSLFILSIFLKVFHSIDLAIYFFSIFFVFIGIFTSKMLSSLLFPNDITKQNLFVFFFTINPIFFTLTNWTATLRGPFISLLPLVFYLNIKLFLKFNFKNFFLFSISFLILALMHRLIILYPIYILILFITFIPIHFKWKPEFKITCIYIIFSFTFIFAGVLFLNSGRELLFNLFNLPSNTPFYILIYKIVLLYYSDFIILFLLLPIGILISHKFSSNNFFYWFFINSILIFSLLITRYDYVEIFLLIPFCYYSCLIFDKYFENLIPLSLKYKNYLLIIFLLFNVVYLILRNHLVFPIRIITLIMILIFTLIPFLIILINSSHFSRAFSKRISFPKGKFYISLLNKNLLLIVILMSTINFTLISSDSSFQETNFPYKSVSNEEIQISNILTKLDLNNSIILSYHYLIARRIEAISHLPVLYSFDSPTMLYYGLISKGEIINQTRFDLGMFFISGVPFKSPQSTFEGNFYNDLIGRNLTNKIDFNYVLSKGVKFIILNKENPASYVASYTPVKAKIFETAVSTCKLIISTQHLSLYEIP